MNFDQITSVTSRRPKVEVFQAERHQLCTNSGGECPPNTPIGGSRVGGPGGFPGKPKWFTVRPENVIKLLKSNEPEFFSRSFWEAPVTSVDDERRRQTASTIRRRLDTIIGDETTVEILLALVSGELTQSEVARAEGVKSSTVNRRKARWYQYVLARWVAEN